MKRFQEWPRYDWRTQMDQKGPLQAKDERALRDSPPEREGFNSSFKTTPATRGTAEVALQHLDASPGPLGMDRSGTSSR